MGKQEYVPFMELNWFCSYSCSRKMDRGRVFHVQKWVFDVLHEYIGNRILSGNRIVNSLVFSSQFLF